MKRFSWCFLLLDAVVLCGCQGIRSSDYLEVYFGVNGNVTEITSETSFTYENSNPLSFAVGSSVVIRLDFLYMPSQKNKGESITIDLSYPNVENLYLDPINDTIAESVQTEEIFTYHLILPSDAYTSFFFAIETSSPISFVPELTADVTIQQVNQSGLEVAASENQNSVSIVTKGKTISLNEMAFI